MTSKMESGGAVAPGFDYADYEAGERRALALGHPVFADWIAALTQGAA